jgi:hypothetical protein
MGRKPRASAFRPSVQTATLVARAQVFLSSQPPGSLCAQAQSSTSIGSIGFSSGQSTVREGTDGKFGAISLKNVLLGFHRTSHVATGQR